MFTLNNNTTIPFLHLNHQYSHRWRFNKYAIWKIDIFTNGYQSITVDDFEWTL